VSVEALVTKAKEGDRGALEALLASVQDDVYRLALRILGLRSEAEDATQEVLIKALTHLSDFRGESTFKTWVWRIAVRHVLGVRRGRREEVASFETIEMLVSRGDANPPLPSLPEAELALLAEEVRLSCTQGMLMSLDRDQRVSYVLAEVFELDGEEAASILEVDPATHRKRLSRARARLAEWMGKHCGLVDEKNACRCRRQIPVAMGFGVVDPKALEYAQHPGGSASDPRLAKRPASRERSERDPVRLPLAVEVASIEASAREIAAHHPAYTAPPVVLEKIRAIIDSGRYRLLS